MGKSAWSEWVNPRGISTFGALSAVVTEVLRSVQGDVRLSARQWLCGTGEASVCFVEAES